MTKLIYIEIQDFDKLKYEQILSSFSVQVQEKVLRLKRWETRYISLLSKQLLLKGMRYFNIDESAIDAIKYTPNNRPFINGSIDFNISHTARCTVCIISDTLKVGIDMETIKEINISDFDFSFQTNEWKAIIESQDPVNTFYNYWTRKEAVIKADGRGMAIPLTDFNVQNDCVVVEGTLWYLKKVDLPISNNYIVHVATDKLLELDEMEIVRFDDYN